MKAKGQANGRAKMTRIRAQRLKRLYPLFKEPEKNFNLNHRDSRTKKKYLSILDWACIFKISQSTAWDILNDKTWVKERC